MQYEQISTVVDAFKWTGDPEQSEDPLWIIEAIRKSRVTFPKSSDGVVSMHILNDVLIEEEDGNTHIYCSVTKVSRGDYVVKETDNDAILAYSPEEFASKYEVIQLQNIDLRGEISQIMSRMLDNPDEQGIYSTTKFLDDMEYFVNTTIIANVKLL